MESTVLLMLTHLLTVIFCFASIVDIIATNPQLAGWWFFRETTTLNGPRTALGAWNNVRRLFMLLDKQFPIIIEQVELCSDVLLIMK